MATLTGNTIASTYTGLLSVTGAVGADTVEAVTDGAGTSTSLSLSQQRATITLGSGAADDFIVDGTTFVVEGDNNRVGIGTASPDSCLLHVHSATAGSVSPNAAADELVLENSGAVGMSMFGGASSTCTIAMGDATAGNYRGVIIYDNNNSNMTFKTANVEALRIDASQRVGIGTASPAFPLNIESTTGGSIVDVIAIGNKSTDANTEARMMFTAWSAYGNGAIGVATDGSSAHGDMKFYTHNGSSLAEKMRITYDGKVGIGETSPLGNLHVKSGDSGVSSPDITDLVVECSGSGGISILAATDGQAEIAFGDSGDPNIGRIAYNHGGDYLATVVNGSEVMRITSAGLIGVASAAASPSHLFDITANDGVSDNNAVARFVNAEATDGRSKGVYIRAGSTADDWPLYIDDHDASNNLLSLRGNGALTAPSTPAFCAILADDADKTTGSEHQLGVGSERFDQGGNFASDQFTAPVTGKYQLNLTLRMTDVPANATYITIQIKTSNDNYSQVLTPTIDKSFESLCLSVLADMDANDTAHISFFQSGGSAQTNIDSESFFSGYLAC